MAMTAGPEHTDSPFHETWILKRIAMIQTALIGQAQQWHSHLPLQTKKNWQAFCREFQKTFDNRQSQTEAKLLLESITRASGEQIKTLALRIEQNEMTRKSYVKNAPDMRNAQMNDPLVKALYPQLARIAPKEIANQKSTALEPQLPYAQLVEKKHQEDITRRHIDRHKLNTNSTLSPSINNLSLVLDNLTVDDIHAMEQDITHGINVVQHKYSNDPNFKGKPLFLKFCKKCSRWGHTTSTCPEKRYTKPLDKPNFQEKTFNQAMKGNQNLPNRQATSNNIKGRPLPFSHRSRSNSREHRNHSRHRSPNQFSQKTQNPIMGTAISDHRVEMIHHTQDQFFKLIQNIILDHNHLTIIGTDTAHDNRSQEIDFVMLEITLIHCYTKNNQTTLRQTLKIQTQQKSSRKNSSNNNLMIYF